MKSAHSLHRSIIKSLTSAKLGLALMICLGVLGSSGLTAPPAQTKPDKVTLIVKMAKGLTLAQAQAVVRGHGATLKASIPKLDLHVVEVPAQASDAITKTMKGDAQILRVESDHIRKWQGTPSDPRYPDQWALPKISWDQVYGVANPRFDTKVAILDTGVDATHPDLTSVVVPGWSVFDGSDPFTDENGHGTWVAGIVAARTDNLQGIAGVGYDHVQIMPVKVLNPTGLGQDSDIIQGVMWAADNGASVILMAFSATGFSDALQDAIDYAWVHNVVLVAAAGNEAGNTATFPAGDRGVIGVSATDQNDNIDPSSTIGASVFLAAPGVNILGTYTNGGYVAWSGTSASAAIVAGSAALMRAVDPSLSNGVIVNRIAESAAAAGTQEQTGNGRVNVARAIDDTSTNEIQPAGTAPFGNGGPFVGPYKIAATNKTMTFTMAGTGGGTVTFARIGTGDNPDTATFGCTAPGSTSFTTCGGSGTFKFKNNDTYRITATPNSGSTFEGWSAESGSLTLANCGGTTNPCPSASGSIALSADSAITATFSLPKLSFTTAVFSITAGQCSPGITVQSQTSTGGVLAVTSNLTVNLTTSSSGTFYSDNACTTSVSSTTISTGNSTSGDFYYKDGTSDGPVLTAAATGYTSGTQTETITTPKLVFTSSTFNIVIGQCSPAITVQSQQTSGPTPLTVSANLTVTLSSSSGTGTFYTDSGCTSSTTTTTISAGNSTSANRYYKDTAAGTPTLTATAAGYTAGTQPGETVTNPKVGTVTVGAQAGTLTYGTGNSVTYPITVARAANGTLSVTLSVTGLPAGATASFSPNPISANGNNPLPSATLTITTIATTPAGSPTFTVKATNDNFAADNSTGNGTLTIAKANATVTVSGYTGTYDAAVHGATAVIAGVDAGGTAAGSSFNPGSSFTNYPGGTANWTFTGGNNYNDKSGTAAIVINKANQTILVSAPSSKIFGDADFSVSATATSGFTVTFAGTTSSVCTLTSTGPGLVSVHIVAAGACSLTANQSGGGNFNPAPDVVVPITINPAKIKTILSITNGKYPNSAYLDTVVLSAKVTDMDHGNASLNSVGFIELKVFALESETSTVVFSATPTLLNGSMASNPSLNLDSNGVGTLSTTDLPVGGPRFIKAIYRPDIPGNYSIQTHDNGTIPDGPPGGTAVDGATCTANCGPPEGSTTVYSGTSDFLVHEVVKADQQAIIFAPGSPLTYNDTELLSASGGSGTGAMTFSVTAGNCSIVGVNNNQLKANSGTGTCDVKASRAGDGNYNPASTTVTVTLQLKSQTITFGALTGKTYGDADFGVSATASSGLAVTFSSQTIGTCTVTGSTVHIVAAGLCTIRASQAGDLNYSAVPTVDQSFTITPRDLTVTPNAGQSKIYGASEPAALTYTHGTLYNGNTDAVFTGSLVRAAGENVGPNGISQGTLSAGSNYTIVFTAGVTFAITPRDLTVTPTAGQSKIYGAADPAALSYTHGTLYNGDTDTVFTGGLVRAAGANVGNYAISQGTLSAGSNYTIVFTAGVTFGITPRDLTVTPTAGQSKIYGATDPAALSYTHGTLYNGDTDTVFTGGLVRAAGANVGNYAISQGTLSAGSNYTIVFTAGVTFAITPRDLSVTPNSGQNKIYGAGGPTLTYTFGTLYNGDTSSVFGGALSRAAGENVGSYAITLGTLSAGSNYTIVFTAGVTFAITPRDLTVTPTAGQSKIYGAANPVLAYTHGALYNGDTDAVFSGALDRTAGENAGSSYVINQGTLSAGSNYTILFTAGVTFAITPRDLTVTPTAGQGKIYGAADPGLTYTHGTLYNGDTDTVFTGSLVRAAGENIGNYAISQGTLSAGSNYTILFTAGVTFAITPRNLTVTPTAGQGKIYGAADPVALTYTHGTLYNGDTDAVFSGNLVRAAGESVGPYAISQGPLSAGSNYAIVFTAGVTFAITPRDLTVTPTSGQSKIYGAGDPTLTYTFGTLYNGDTSAVFSGALSRAAGANVGSYAITVGTLSAGSNYMILLGSVTFAITPRDLTVVPTAGQSKIYGAANPVLAYTHGTLYNGDTDAVFSGALDRTAGENVGSSYVINQGTLSAGFNYTIVFTAGVTFALTPRDLTVTPTAGQNKIYGAGDPTLTYTFGTLYNGDTSAVFSGALSRAAGENVGNYAIIQGTLSAGSNYTIIFTAGVTFAVTPRDLTVTPTAGQGKIYGAADLAALTYTHGTLYNGDTDAVFTGGLVRAAGENVGNSAISKGTLSAGPNYNIVLSSVTFAITPRDLSVTPNSGQNKIYGAGDPTLTYTFGTLYNGDTIAVFSGALSRAAGANVGSYAITVGTLSAGSNYTIVLGSVTFAITPRNLTVTPTAGQSKIYGAANPVLAYTHGALYNGDTDAVFSGALSRAAGENVGSYAITVGTLSAGSNYTIIFTSGVTFAITPAGTSAALTVTSPVQYSDLSTFVVTLSPNSILGVQPATGVQFKIDGNNIGALQTLTAGGGSLTASLTPQILVGPGNHAITAVFTGVNSNFTVNSPSSQNLAVTQEDARAAYTGLLYVTTSSPASSTATVVLSATIQDITATADAAGDTNFGDIRNATVTFINRDTNTPIATNLPVGLVNAGDTKTGTATYSWTVDIGNADAATYTIGVIVNNYYTRNSSTENATLDVKKPTPGSIGGGGFLINASSAGTYAGTPGAKTNFGLNVKFNKNNTNLQGNTNIIIRQTDGSGIVHVYQIKSNATDSLNITSPSAGVYKASFTAKATVTDITNPLAPVSLGGNKNLQIMITDNGEPGSADTIAIMLTDSGGGLLFSSMWNGTTALEQLLGGGNLQVRPN